MRAETWHRARSACIGLTILTAVVLFGYLLLAPAQILLCTREYRDLGEICVHASEDLVWIAATEPPYFVFPYGMSLRLLLLMVAFYAPLSCWAILTALRRRLLHA